MLKVLQVSAEIYPLVKTGGLADIAGALPAALRTVGCEPRVLLPGFSPILADLQDAKTLCELVAPWGDRVLVRSGTLATLGLGAYVIDVPQMYCRPGSPYEDEQRQPYADNHRRFALLGFVAAQLAQGLDRDWQPELVHCHDWHAGLAPSLDERPVSHVYTRCTTWPTKAYSTASTLPSWDCRLRRSRSMGWSTTARSRS
jgi:starch synthase